MAGLTPNTANIELVAKPTSDAVRTLQHPEYQYWRPDWQKMRDVLAGQREIKRKREIYLPRMGGMDDDDYKVYLQKATFYNMTAQTLNGMVGQVFRTPPLPRQLPSKFKDAVRRFAKDGTGLSSFIKTVISEQIGLGRFGVLIDAPSVASRKAPTSYAVGYTTENIIDWDVEEVSDGFYAPTRVLLREFVRQSDYMQQAAYIGMTSAEARAQRAKNPKFSPFGGPSPGITPLPSATGYGSIYHYITMYRELILEPQYNNDGDIVGRIYRQNVYKDDLMTLPIKQFTPMIRGETLDFIPFVFFGSESNAADIEKPPLLDICDLNLSHYQTYADLEWGRTYTALPVYYAPGNDSESADVYNIGPSRVWEVPAEASPPGILEYSGSGLKTLETALNIKEQQIAAIGGRMMPGTTKSVSESNNQTNLREANEQSLLLNTIQAAETGASMMLRWWLMFRDVPMTESVDIFVEVNQDFLRTPIGAREIRAIQLMYMDGIIPVDALFTYLRKAEIVPSTMELDEFKVLLNDPDSFLNNPDIAARQRGFMSRAQEIEQASAAREADIADRKLDIAERAVEVDEQMLEIAAKADSTSIVGTRKLGDPEQAEPSVADSEALAIQKTTAEKPTPAPVIHAPPGAAPKPAAQPTPTKKPGQ